MTTQTFARAQKVDPTKLVARLKESSQQKRSYRRSVEIAFFVAGTKNCGTEDVMTGLGLGGAQHRRLGGSVPYAMSNTSQVLKALVKAEVLVKELVTQYVPPSSESYGVNSMGGRHVKDGKAVWKVHPDLLVDVEK